MEVCTPLMTMGFAPGYTSSGSPDRTGTVTCKRSSSDSLLSRLMHNESFFDQVMISETPFSTYRGW